jgi:hypothetical protein
MFPLLREGDLLYVEEMPGRKVKIGELLCFKKDDIYICHRLILKRRKAGKLVFLEKPDVSLEGGSYIGPDMVIGRVTKALRGTTEIELGEGCLRRYLHLAKFIFYKLRNYIKNSIFT